MFRWHRQLLLNLMAAVVGISSAHAQDIITTEYGNVFVIPFKQYLDPDKRPSCSRLPRLISYKAFQSQDNHNFTAEEYRQLAGDAPYMGLRGHNSWYDRDQRKMVSWDDLFPVYGDFSSGKWDDLPVLCGARDQPKPNPAAVSRAKKSVDDYPEFTDYVLHRAPGLVTHSHFYSAGKAWCQHAYVSVIAEYENDQVKSSLLAANPAAYLQNTIIPKIKQICPDFPNANPHSKQLLVLKFRPEERRIADERINPDKLNFKIDDAGHLKLVRDTAYRNWLTYNDNPDAREAISNTVEAENKRVLARESDWLELYITAADIGLNLAYSHRDIHGNSKRVRRQIDYYEYALEQLQKASKPLEQAVTANQALSLTTFDEVDALLKAYFSDKSRGRSAMKRAESLSIKQ
ncbi:hypothetical protein [Haliea sp.]|jgi:hypothetical protein|uniref:hypothetical protein n=2 Tax=Haliea TaxID=475794 RepID=UPI000C361C23|nr:hypothetical protein [Haliea sp.]MAD62516.1 hypothetical protein [Haliea sp.]